MRESFKYFLSLIDIAGGIVSLTTKEELDKYFPLSQYSYSVFSLKDNFPYVFLRRLTEITGEKPKVRESSLSPKFKVIDYSFFKPEKPNEYPLIISHIIDKYGRKQYLVRLDLGGLSSTIDYILLCFYVDIMEYQGEPELMYSDEKYLVIRKGKKEDFRDARGFKVATLYIELWGSWYSVPSLRKFGHYGSFIFKIPIEYLRELFMEPIKKSYKKVNRWALWYFVSE